MYYPHLEFQAEARANMALRCFGHSTRLIMQIHLGVEVTGQHCMLEKYHARER